MSAKHTPGPWFVQDIPTASIYISPAGGRPSVALALTKVNVPAGETMANARLIAAAPDLLEALRYLLDNDGDCSADGIATCRAAIAKATGEAA